MADRLHLIGSGVSPALVCILLVESNGYLTSKSCAEDARILDRMVKRAMVLED